VFVVFFFFYPRLLLFCFGGLCFGVFFCFCSFLCWLWGFFFVFFFWGGGGGVGGGFLGWGVVGFLVGGLGGYFWVGGAP
ncbi:hypothetical protein, partial [Stenotrophomonas maltophilia]|uniref:hypothetical protein n=1 Tax=Stenotrophomonas maltophilia TaxID=40324 RepID=UPI0034E234CB